MRQNTKRILFADDEVRYAKAIPGFFKSKKIDYYEFDFVHTPEDAIDQLEYTGFDYDLIIIDLRFKAEDLAGLKIVKYLSKKLVEIPSIIITAYANKKNLQECLKQRPYKLLEKPFDLASLKAAIQEVFKKVARKEKSPHSATARRLFNQITGRNKVNLLIDSLESLDLEQYEEVSREMPMIQLAIKEDERYKAKIDNSWKETGKIPLPILKVASLSVEMKNRKLASGEPVVYGPFVYMRWKEEGKQQQYYLGKIEDMTNPDVIDILYQKYQKEEKIRRLDQLGTIPLLYEKYCYQED